jgi:hypothetical protein
MKSAWKVRQLSLTAMMLVGTLALWVGIPLGWLWIGSQLQAGTGSLSVSLGAMMAGVVVSGSVLAWVLGWLGRKHAEIKELRGQTDGPTALEQILVLSTAVAVIAFAVWFFGFSGSAPLPLKIGY